MLTWLQQCLFITIMMVDILDMVVMDLHFALRHSFFSCLGGGGASVAVVYSTLPPAQELSTVLLLPKSIYLLGETLFNKQR